MKVLEIRSYRMATTLTALRVRVVIYSLGAYKVFIGSVAVETQKGLIRLVIERPSALFNSQNDWRATIPPYAHHFPTHISKL